MTIEGLHAVVLCPPRTVRVAQTAQRFTFTQVPPTPAGFGHAQLRSLDLLFWFQVFGPDASQRNVFDGSVRGSVREVLGGGNCLVFTYGVTNAGKTFTFLGLWPRPICAAPPPVCGAIPCVTCPSSCPGPDHDGGLLPRSLDAVFNSIRGRVYGGGDLKPHRCRDFSRLTPPQQEVETCRKRNLLRMFKEVPLWG